MDKKEASILIEKYLKGKCKPEERSTLLAHFNQYLDENRDTLSPEEIQKLSKITWEAIHNQIDQHREEKVVTPLWRKWFPYVAAVFAFLVGTWLFIQRQATDSVVTAAAINDDVIPIGGGATLTLADGRTIALDTAQSGIIFSGEKITYQSGVAADRGKLSATPYKLSTPKGATYHLTLPDGTKVWLNGNSEITYPGRFDDSKRIVSLKGEAFFDVVRKDDVPFVVKTQGQEIEVLGTTFNISTYKSSSVKTTLVEGSVRVISTLHPQSSLLLQPGEQSVLGDNGILDKKKANLDKELAWKSDLFYFDKTPFEEVMLQIAHWYDVDVYYEKDAPVGTFSGIMDRTVSLKTLLEFFGESSPFDFRLENRNLMITPKVSGN